MHPAILPTILALIALPAGGIVLGLIPVTLAGLFMAAWIQYRRGGSLGA